LCPQVHKIEQEVAAGGGVTWALCSRVKCSTFTDTPFSAQPRMSRTVWQIGMIPR
jgi:hypothetical protein